VTAIPAGDVESFYITGYGQVPREVRELLIFVGSPGDLPEERSVVREAALSVTSSMSELGIRLSVYGWEEQQPARGRPQELINQQVDTCDIFIGLMYRRWGSPTGEFTSGFEEEFHRVMQRPANDDFPKVALFFKNIDADTLGDPGEGVAKVLAFKREQQNSRDLLYKEFSDAPAFKLLVISYLTKIITSIVSPTLANSPESPAPNPSPVAVITDKSIDNGRRQVGDTLQAYAGIFKDPPVIPTTDGRSSLDRDRLLLFALAVNSAGQELPVHVANSLYLRRHYLEMLEMESVLWLRTFASDVSRSSSWQTPRSVPAWGIVTGADASKPIDLVVLGNYLAAQAIGDDASVVAGIFILLRQIRVRPELFWDNSKNPVDRWLAILSLQHIPDAVFAYIIEVATDKDSAMIEALIQRASDSKVAASLNIIRDYLTKGLSAVEDTIKAQLPATEWLIHLIKLHLSGLSCEFLREIVSISRIPVEVRISSLSRLIDSGELTAMMVTKILTGRDQPIQDCLLAGIDKIDQSTLNQVFLNLDKSKMDTSIYTQVLGSVADIDTLKRSLESNPLNIDSWAALAWKTGNERAGAAREIMDSDLSAHEDVLSSVEEAAPGKKLSDFIKAQFRKAALELIMRLPVEDRDDEDIERARRELAKDHWLTRDTAEMAIASFGTSADLPTLLQMITKSHLRRERDHIARSIIRIGGLEMARLLTSDSNEDIAQMGAHSLAESDLSSDEELRAVLYNQHASVRLIALEALVERSERSQLEELLTAYPKQAQSYYYNVVVELDQILYGPNSNDSDQQSVLP
jgi:hypothetical protein